MRKRDRIGITMGDPSGVGPEIIIKALKKISNYQEKIRIIGSLSILEKVRESIKIKIDLKPIVYSLIDDFNYKLGKVQKQCGEFAFECLKVAVDLYKTHNIKAIVTAPVSKDALRLAGFKYPGQTEFFADMFNIKNYGMLAYSRPLKIILVTTHSPITKVSKMITTNKVLKKIILIGDFLKDYLKIKEPKIGVLSLNPHSFEFSLGEEKKVLRAINRAKKRKIKVSGPFAPDTIYDLIKDYDGFVAMYHDQGMIPVKLLSPFSGVNITLGLPFLRTAPLHGVGFDIAGKGIAQSQSMENAINFALHSDEAIKR